MSSVFNDTGKYNYKNFNMRPLTNSARIGENRQWVDFILVLISTASISQISRGLKRVRSVLIENSLGQDFDKGNF